MRKFVTVAAAALAMTVAAAAPAFADQYNNYPYQHGYSQNHPSGNHYGDDYRYPRDGRFDRRYYDRYDFNSHNGNFDRWERGWNRHGYDDRHYRYQKPMSLRKIVRSLAHQGFYGVRGLERARYGWGYRAFAFDQRGRPVMLRVNAFNGRVMQVRYI